MRYRVSYLTDNALVERVGISRGMLEAYMFQWVQSGYQIVRVEKDAD